MMRSTRYREGKVKEFLKGSNSEEDSFKYTFGIHDLTQSIFWSISKFIREGYSCRIPIIVFDKAPYHKLTFLTDYKGDRHYYSEEDLEGIDKDTNPKEWHETSEEIRANEIKQNAKYWIVENFPKLGIPVIIHPGYEGDDLAYLTANALKEDTEKSALVSIDGDWSYLTNPNVDHLKPNGDKITYQDMVNTEMAELTDLKDLSLYKLKSFSDSVFGSHNNLTSVELTDDIGFKELITHLYHDQFDILKDKDLYLRQLRSFDVYSYPEIDIVKGLINNNLKPTYPMDEQEFSLLRTMTGFKVSVDYYLNTIENMDLTRYERPDNS